MNNDFALIIGINDYTPLDRKGLKTLSGAIADAEHIASWLLDPAGGNVPPENIQKVTSQKDPLLPIQDQIDAAFLEIKNTIEREKIHARRFYFYFAGHGVSSIETAKEIALCLANWSEDLRHSALGAELYKKVINDYGFFEEIIFITDCCRNTKINVHPVPPRFSPTMAAVNAGNTRILVANSTKYQNRAFEMEDEDGEARGIFTKVLLDGLNGSAADENGHISAAKLTEFLTIQTPIEAKKHGYNQEPHFTIEAFTSQYPIHTVANLIQTVDCTLSFGAGRTDVSLYNGSGDIIRTFLNKDHQHETIELRIGMYMLQDNLTGEEKYIRITNLNEPRHEQF